MKDHIKDRQRQQVDWKKRRQRDNQQSHNHQSPAPVPGPPTGLGVTQSWTKDKDAFSNRNHAFHMFTWHVCSLPPLCCWIGNFLFPTKKGKQVLSAIHALLSSTRDLRWTFCAVLQPFSHILKFGMHVSTRSETQPKGHLTSLLCG